ncbi:MAG: preQ(1) synthase [Desulfuromonadales bacterium]|nr:preQ(1) synthase [Desulfuromonadales bacterium]
MTINNEGLSRTEAGLQSLGKASAYPQDYTAGVLETFENRHLGRDYWTLLECLEFSSLCPITDQPDWATIYIRYVANLKMVESKSLKLYLHGFRNRGDFHEDVINVILGDLVTLMQPRYLEVLGIFHPRGGIAIHPFVNWGSVTARADAPGQCWADYARQRRDNLTLSETLGSGRHLR